MNGSKDFHVQKLNWNQPNSVVIPLSALRCTSARYSMCDSLPVFQPMFVDHMSEYLIFLEGKLELFVSRH
jgi:hypothetical protein